MSEEIKQKRARHVHTVDEIQVDEQEISVEEIDTEVGSKEIEPIIEEIVEPIVTEEIKIEVSPVKERSLQTVELEGKLYVYELKFNQLYANIDTENYRLPSIKELPTVISLIKPPKGTYWSSNTFVNSPLLFVYCITSEGKSIEQSSNKEGHAVLLKEI